MEVFDQLSLGARYFKVAILFLLSPINSKEYHRKLLNVSKLEFATLIATIVVIAVIVESFLGYYGLKNGL